jgi:AhpD family alkylhydroperoxidase
MTSAASRPDDAVESIRKAMQTSVGEMAEWGSGGGCPSSRDWSDSTGVESNWTREIAEEWPKRQQGAGPSVVVMTTSTALEKNRLPEHAQRLDWMTLAPDVFKAMVRLDTATGQGVEAEVLHLVKIRSSQINRCAYCIDMHTKEALAAGESVERIIQLGAWRESKHFYTAKEIAAIELTEAVTVLTDGFVPDDVYGRAAGEFTETEVVYLIGAITIINAWNRFGVSTRMVPGHYTPAS